MGNFGVTRPTTYLEFVTNFVLSFVMLCFSAMANNFHEILHVLDLIVKTQDRINKQTQVDNLIEQLHELFFY